MDNKDDDDTDDTSVFSTDRVATKTASPDVIGGFAMAGAGAAGVRGPGACQERYQGGKQN